MNGIALAVLISQLPKLFGFSIESTGPLRDLWAIGQAIFDGKANWAAAALGWGRWPHPAAQTRNPIPGSSSLRCRRDGDRRMVRP
jgi:hypothetical protein